MGALGSGIVFSGVEHPDGRSINVFLTIDGGSGVCSTGFMSCAIGLASLSRAINEAIAVRMLTWLPVRPPPP